MLPAAIIKIRLNIVKHVHYNLAMLDFGRKCRKISSLISPLYMLSHSDFGIATLIYGLRYC